MKPFLFTLVIIASLLFTLSHAHLRDLIPFVQVKPDHHESPYNGADSTALVDESEPNLTQVTNWGVHDNQEIIRERIKKLPNLAKKHGVIKRRPRLRNLHRCRFNRVRPTRAQRPGNADPKLIEFVFKLTRGLDAVHRKARAGGSDEAHAQILTRRHIGRKFPDADVEEREKVRMSIRPPRHRHHGLHGYHYDEFDHDRDHDEDRKVVIKGENGQHEGGEESEMGVLSKIRKFVFGRNNKIRKFLAYF